jgi:hypothetical protein
MESVLKVYDACSAVYGACSAVYGACLPEKMHALLHSSTCTCTCTSCTLCPVPVPVPSLYCTVPLVTGSTAPVVSCVITLLTLTS